VLLARQLDLELGIGNERKRTGGQARRRDRDPASVAASLFSCDEGHLGSRTKPSHPIPSRAPEFHQTNTSERRK